MRNMAVLLGALVLAACAGVEFNPAPNAKDYGRYRGEVSVLEAFPPEDRFERIGIVIVRGAGLADKETLLNRARAEAAKRGANAVVLQGEVKVRRTASGGEEKLLGVFALRVPP